MKTVKLTTEQARHLENYVEDHMFMCAEYLDEVNENEAFEPFGPYDGCSTCETRELLMAAIEWFRKNKILDIYIDDDVELHTNH